MSGLEPIAGIRPVAPDVSLLTSGATPLPPGTVWRSGVSWRGASCVTAHGWPGICPPASLVDAEKAAAPAIAERSFRPFSFYVPYACDWVTPDEEGGMDGDATAQVEAVTAFQVSRELWTGEHSALEADVNDRNESLMSTASDLTNVDAVNDVFAIGALLSEYAGCTQTTGGAVLHVPIVLIPDLVHRGVLTQVGNVLRGPLGVPVSPGPGYPGTGPWGPDGEVAYPGSVWVYVSGPIEYALGGIDLEPEKVQRRFNHRRNRYELWAERRAIVRFDPCCVFAILVDVPNVAPEAS